MTPLDVKPSEVNIVQGERKARGVYFGGYGFKYAPVLPVYGKFRLIRNILHKLKKNFRFKN